VVVIITSFELLTLGEIKAAAAEGNGRALNYLESIGENLETN
jgi:hypothetical protein